MESLKRLGRELGAFCLRYPAIVVTPIALLGLWLWLSPQLPKSPQALSRSANPGANPGANLGANLPPNPPVPFNGAMTSPSANPLANPSVSASPFVSASPSPSASPTSSASPTASPTPNPKGTPIAQSKLGSKPGVGPKQPIVPPSSPPTSGIAALSFDAMVTMQVLIAGGISGVDLSSSSGATVTDAQGQSLTQLREGVRVQSNGGQISWNGQSLPPLVFVDPNPGGLLYLNGKPYRGRLLLTSADGSLWAVNYVNLQQYLYSVVGSEVSPSWPAAALKAQTVAARSYALYYHLNPANPLFHIGSDEYYQVYSGARTEAPEVIQAVKATLGEYISHRGGIVESLYAASDDIVSEAFGGQGMSQLGARDFAAQGYSYTQILNHYYPGTKIGRIAVGGD
jgi:stage II sporulation protein D